jgi:hypothetical protein
MSPYIGRRTSISTPREPVPTYALRFLRGLLQRRRGTKNRPLKPKTCFGRWGYERVAACRTLDFEICWDLEKFSEKASDLEIFSEFLPRVKIVSLINANVH